jgi:hypothetical protein
MHAPGSADHAAEKSGAQAERETPANILAAAEQAAAVISEESDADQAIDPETPALLTDEPPNQYVSSLGCWSCAVVGVRPLVLCFRLI